MRIGDKVFDVKYEYDAEGLLGTVEIVPATVVGYWRDGMRIAQHSDGQEFYGHFHYTAKAAKVHLVQVLRQYSVKTRETIEKDLRQIGRIEQVLMEL